MKLNSFTESGLDMFRRSANFTPIESACFEMKAKKDVSDVQLAMEVGISTATVSRVMRRVREKVLTVIQENVKEVNEVDDNFCFAPVAHTVEEWSKLPDMISKANIWYVYTDYRTETRIINGKEVVINVARFKYGDGVTPISHLPFVTAAITDNDIAEWDESLGNDFGTPIVIVGSYVFPSDGYIMLEFDSAEEFAKVKICGASGRSFFEFEKRQGIDIHSKEVFVKRGMKCEYVTASKGAVIKFVLLI